EVAALATQMLQSVLGPDAIKHGGYTVETAIDLDLQSAARKALRTGLIALDARNHLQGPLRPPKQKRKQERVKDLVVGRSYDAFVTASNDARGEIVLDIGGRRAIASLADLSRWNPNHLRASEFAPAGSQVVAAVESLAEGDAPVHARLLLGPQGA